MPILSSIQLDVPASFPIQAYEALLRKVRRLHSEHPNTAKIVQAWSGLAYRYYEARDCAGEFEQSVDEHGTGPAFPERYRQERLLFDFFGSAVSAIDCCAFAMFAMAGIRDPANFPLSNHAAEKKATPSTLLAKLEKAFPVDPTTDVWRDLLADQRYADIHQIRNILTHRLAFGRHHHQGGAKDGITEWGTGGPPIRSEMLRSYADNLDCLLSMAIPNMVIFATDHLAA